MDHNSNGLRIKIKVRNGNAATMNDDNGNKQFCSVGHMRFDSEARTMEKGLLVFQPPTPVTTNRRSSSSFSSSPSSSPSAVVDCSLSLPSWSLTGQRGRKGISTSCAVTTTTVPISDDLHDTKRMKIETYSDHDKSPKKKMHSEEKKIKKMKKNEALEKEYKCNICSKVFLSPRAMGGHKSSHYKTNNKTDVTIKKDAASTAIGTIFESKTMFQTEWKKVIDFDLNELPPGDEEAILESCFLHL